MNLKNLLVKYYGVLQVLHFIANFLAIFVLRDEAFSALSKLITPEDTRILIFSSYIDFFIASPFGIAWVFAYLKNSKWANLLGAISLNFAAASAFLYVYMLLTLGVWEFTPLNTIILVAFAPISLVYIVWAKSALSKS